MICLILLIQCPNRPESYSQSFEKPEQTPLNQLSLYKFIDFRFYDPILFEKQEIQDR